MSVTDRELVDLFFFGPLEQQLFGAFHEAETFAQRETGVVICYPFGHEYIRAHRACRHLARQLSAAGFPVIRFDYGGTGDSAGDGESACLNDWRRDIGLAIDELKDQSGVETVSLVGIRLGAALAVEAASARPEVNALVLWEPIVDGRSFLDDLKDQHRELLWRFFDDAGRYIDPTSNELLGFPVGDCLRTDLDELDLMNSPPVHRPRMLVIDHDRSPAIADLVNRYFVAGIDVTHQHIESFAIWREDVDKGLVPDTVLRSITTWAAEELP